MEIEYTVQIWREGGQCIAHAMPLDVASCGATSHEARAALEEAVKLFIETAKDHGTLHEVLEEAGYKSDGSTWHSPDWVCFERRSAAVSA
jgi:predicted RNase H-like HicB family nuclease